MQASTLNASTFKASTINGPLSGTVSYTGNTATLLLDNRMPANTVINAADHGHIGLVLQNRRNAIAEYGMIVDDENADL
jgi:hypothetical protein